MKLYKRPIIRLIAVLGVMLSAAICAAQNRPERVQADQLELTQQAELYTRVRLFDFDERKLGNYEDTPLHWSQLHHRHCWAPARRALPLYNIDPADIPWQYRADNLAPLEAAREARNTTETPQNPAQPPPRRIIHICA